MIAVAVALAGHFQCAGVFPLMLRLGRQHALRLIDDRVVDELAVQLNRRGLGGFGGFESFHDPLRPGDLFGRGTEGRVDDGHLIGMNTKLALKAHAAGAMGRGRQPFRILHIDPDGVDRSRQAVGARCKHQAAAVVHQFALIARPFDIHIKREVGRAKGEAPGAGSG